MNQAFTSSESGAVTVDWVVLTAALVGLGLATMTVVSGGVSDLSTDIDTQLKSDGIIQTAFVEPFVYTPFSQAYYDSVIYPAALARSETDTVSNYDSTVALALQRIEAGQYGQSIISMDNVYGEAAAAAENGYALNPDTATPEEVYAALEASGLLG